MYIRKLHFDLLNSGAGNKTSMFMLEAVGVMLLAPTVFTGMCKLCDCSSTNEVRYHVGKCYLTHQCPRAQRKTLDFWGVYRDFAVFTSFHSGRGKVLVGECEGGD